MKRSEKFMSLSLFQQNVPLSRVCTFGIGGPAKYFVEVRSIEEMQKVLQVCTNQCLSFFILGKGSNCLFDNQGYNGVVILNKIDFIERPTPGVYHVGGGYSFSLLGTQTARQGWSGLEFASGIPGSVGGALFMNAGANGGETSTYLTTVDFVDAEGILQTIPKEDLSFSYRTSSFQSMSGAIVGATFTLLPSSEARNKQIEIIEYRKRTQPYGDKSAGCVFRNPCCGHAGALIEKSGLKGFCVGGAKVSEKHANFIVNTNEATSQDILTLIAKIKSEVKEKLEIDLESEIRYVPFVF